MHIDKLIDLMYSPNEIENTKRIKNEKKKVNHNGVINLVKMKMLLF